MNLPVDDKLNQAIEHHGAQRFDEAQALYRSILQADPRHAQANHYMGLLAVQTGDVRAGLPYLRAAAEAAPGHEDYEAVYADAVALANSRTEAAPQTPASGDALADEFVATLRVLAQLQNHGQVEALARQMVSLLPDHPDGWKALSGALLQQGRVTDAVGPLRQAAALAPGDEATRRLLQFAQTFDTAIAEHQKGQLDRAEALYLEALHLQPDNPDANYNMGTLAVQTARYDAALPHFETAIGAYPNRVQYWASYANALHLAGQNAAAAIALDMARQRGLAGPALETLALLITGDVPQAAPAARPAAAAPTTATREGRAAVAHFNAGRLAEAEAAARRVVEHAPLDALGWKVLGCALHQQKRLHEALAPLERTLELHPDDCEALQAITDTLRHRGERQRAEFASRRLLALRPDFPEAHRLLGAVLAGQGQYAEAQSRCRRAVEMMPDSALAHDSLGAVLLESGDLAGAEACYRRALEIEPGNKSTHTSLLFCMSHSENTSPAELAAAHRHFGEVFETPLLQQRIAHAIPRDPERTLNVGFVSGDLLNHAVASFFEPVLARLARDRSLTLHAYYNFTKTDAATTRLRAHFAHWTPVFDLSDEALAERIRADGIDVLIDLSGHTDRHRLLTFARKPAPVQASWIGYPGSTGLSAIDYYIADRFFVPHELAGQFTEKLLHLPAIAPFMPEPEAPPVNPLPALSNGHLTFGSFNRLNKLRPNVIALWSRLLRALPDARLMLAGMPQNANLSELIGWFGEHGIVRERLDFRPRASVPVYLEQHHRVDICLDTFPYAGGTTTLHSLWMGVPTLTLPGGTVPSRGSSRSLAHLGLESFIARDADDFVRKGIDWASRIPELAALREEMRARCLRSPMFQPEVVAHSLSRALRIAWRRWCDGLPPVAFEVPGDTGRAHVEFPESMTPGGA